METQNLWPDFPVEKIKSPKAILKEQAGYLMAKTSNILSADIETAQDSGQIVHQFYVVAPAMNSYRYKIFSVRHGVISYYPLTVTWDGRALWEGPDEYKAEDQDHFISVLSEIFTNGDTIRIISSLLSQSLAE